MPILDFSLSRGVFSGLGGWFFYQMASFGPLQSSGMVALSNFDFTHLSIHPNLTEICRHSIQITFEQDSLTFIHSGSPWSKRSDLKIYFCTSHFLSVSDLSILVVDAHLQTKLFDRPPFDGETLALSFQDTARFPTTQSFFSKIQWYVFSKILPGCFWLKHLIVQYEDLVDMASFSKVRFAWTAWVGWHWP